MIEETTRAGSARRPTAAPDGARGALAAAARVILGAVFVYSGFPKAVAPPQEFKAVIEAYYIPLPPGLLSALASVLPWAELLFGLFLVAGYLTRASAAAAAAMLGMFLAALSYTKFYHIPLDNCGCFGSLHVSPSATMGFDAGLLAVAVLAYRFGRERWSLDNWIDAAPGGT